MLKKELTLVSDSNGDKWQTASLTDTHTGKAMPFMATLPFLPLFLKMLATRDSMASSPNRQMSTILASGTHYKATHHTV
jgi:hypothetical protein